ncbi:MAG: sporulation transcription factor Spo0A [Christensenellales bacterium]|jgi:two-component system response regulator (stage 0 sporulation protein A)|nr:sporulation transcription factor Spo0A [Clostridia bacterium]HRU84669.1 sporulation transcription factor Spo0A [Eubacteriales bacterium]
MSKKSILIADDNLEFSCSLQKYFQNDEEFEVVATAANGLDALDAVERYGPKFLVLDIVMPELDGFGVLAQLDLEFRENRPIVIMMSQLTGDGFISKALRMGASHYFAKPVNPAALRESMLDFVLQAEPVSRMNRASAYEPQQKSPTRQPQIKSLDEKIANIFISVGIPAHIKGYQFLREAIKMAVKSPEIINAITKRLYPSIAEQFDTSASKVERAIRHAIEVAWNRGKIENINSIFGVNVYSPNEKPTNGEFIALVADKMLLEGA